MNERRLLIATVYGPSRLVSTCRASRMSSSGGRVSKVTMGWSGSVTVDAVRGVLRVSFGTVSTIGGNQRTMVTVSVLRRGCGGAGAGGGGRLIMPLTWL